ncbi:hypothetical protein [uncultured Tateyamaria sp.]|uniref:hypothetical protein n=1 Tax=uncultured Tateyamaria sp. TaxID=455651 RepID=UPI00262869F5|nr:hypothetical protein [uncultured Tateyamaria sp.]
MGDAILERLSVLQRILAWQSGTFEQPLSLANMDHDKVLDIRALANADFMYFRAHHDVWPYRRLASNGDFSKELCRRG